MVKETQHIVMKAAGFAIPCQGCWFSSSASVCAQGTLLFPRLQMLRTFILVSIFLQALSRVAAQEYCPTPELKFKDYACYRQLHPKLHLYWKIRAPPKGGIVFAAKLRDVGYVGLAFGSTPNMKDSLAVIHGRGTDSAVLSDDTCRLLTARGPGASSLDCKQFAIGNKSGTDRTNETYLEFTRNFGEGNPPFVKDQPFYLLWSFGISARRVIENHGPDQRGAFLFPLEASAAPMVPAVGIPTSPPLILNPAPPAPPPVLAGIPLKLSPSCPNENVSTCYVADDNKFIIQWRARPNYVDFAVTVKTGGWVSVAWSNTISMVNSDAVIYAKANGKTTLHMYRLLSKNMSGILYAPSLFFMDQVQVENRGGVVAFRFTRKYGDGEVPLRQGSNNLLWAYADSNLPDLSISHGNKRGYVVLNLFSPGSPPAPLATVAKPMELPYEWHGWIMYAAFGWLFPVGIFIARFAQMPALTPLWFYLHRVFTLAGWIAATASAVIAFRSIRSGLESDHARLGLGVLVLVWAQPLIGILKPRKGASYRIHWYTLHWLAGTSAQVLGCANIYLGLARYKALGGEPNRLVPAVYTVHLVVLGFLYLFLSQLPYIWWQGQPHFPPVEMLEDRNDNKPLRTAAEDTTSWSPLV